MTAVSSSGAAQTSTPAEQPVLGATFTAGFLRDLPLSGNPFAALETIQPEVIADRFSSGGLNLASAPRLGGFLNSWTQTEIRIGDVAVTDPHAGGTPLLLPILPFWERLTTTTGALGVDDSAPGLSMTLDPLRPGAKWFRAIEGSLSASPFVSGPSGAVPAIDRVDALQDVSALVSGPLTDRLGLVAAGAWRGLSHVATPETNTTSDSSASGFAHLVFAATARDEIRALGWLQRGADAAVTDTGVHVQSTWERRNPGRTGWRLFGGYSGRSRSAPMAASIVVDSLLSDPVSDLVDPGAGTARRWTLGARATPSARRGLPTFGVDVEGALAHVDPSAIIRIGELVDATPTRLWTFRAGTGSDDRHLTRFAAFANEHVTAGRLTLDAGLRLDRVTAAADASTQDIRWTTWLPSVRARWQVAHKGDLAAVAGHRRSAYRLPLNVLAIGNPAAPVADVSLWNGVVAGAPIAQVGPGTGGDAAFTRIDPQLERPTTDELLLAIQGRPLRWLQLEASAITKREGPLLDLVDTGVPASAYRTFQVADPSFEPGSPVGSPFVTVFDRPPGSYGRDRYLLTNRTDNPASFWGTGVGVRVSTARLTLLARGTIWTRTYGDAAAIGYLPTENDQDVLGSTFVDPNAASLARGQLFQDRSHTAKVAAVYQLPWRVRFGTVARWQDGQPFARLIVVPGLTQGRTAVRGFVNGGSAFTYTGTLDVRVQKTFSAGLSDATIVVDVYNLPNLDNEVSERVVSGPTYRTPTALQPPRTVVMGLRVTF